MPKVLNARKLRRNYGKNDVYVGRPSKWGNPFVIGKDGSREKVLELYRKYLSTSEEFTPSVIREELKGKNLICWCAPEACHADILLEIANG